MTIKKEAVYALKLMLYISQRENKSNVASASSGTSVDENQIVQCFESFKAAGIAELSKTRNTVRCEVCRAPSNITQYEVLRAIQTDLPENGIIDDVESFDTYHSRRWNRFSKYIHALKGTDISSLQNHTLDELFLLTYWNMQ